MDNHKKVLDFFVRQLFLTQNLIESIHPKLIIVLNKDAFYIGENLSITLGWNILLNLYGKIAH
jgi:hypothetical protein